MEKFIQLVEKFGLEGEKLLEFVREQEEIKKGNAGSKRKKKKRNAERKNAQRNAERKSVRRNAERKKKKRSVDS